MKGSGFTYATFMDGLGAFAWRNNWRLRAMYHRYQVIGAENLIVPGPLLIVGYHGRPVAHDLCMLQIWMADKHGMACHPVMHASAAKTPLLKHAVRGMQMVTGDGPALERAIAQGGKIIVTPGGLREGARPWTVRYQVDWGGRRGYLRLAMKYSLPIVPVAGVGVDDTYIGLNNGNDAARKLHIPAGLPAWVGVGPLGLWPLSPPFPVAIATRVGEPIRDHLSLDFQNSEGSLLALDEKVRTAVQSLLSQRKAP